MTEVLREPSGPAAEGALFDLEAPCPELPVAQGARFAPLRAGILNLWQYDDQELRFHQGRLLLRGENGTGKSKALELLLPFLLDADLSPHRLDPFAGTARTMYWNLLEGERHDSRVGYVWLELGRRAAEDEAPVYWTIGCGLRATRRTRRVDSWYFVARRRVGGDLELVTPQGVPLLKDELARALGDDGTVYDTGKEYRERLDQLFFGLGEDRFAALRHLLLQLRRPQLSQKLDPASLSELLAESLPPVDSALVAQLSEGFERLEEDERELVRVEVAGREVEGFLEIYRRYGRGVARGRAAAVRQADSRYHKTAAEVREAEAERDRIEDELAALHDRREANGEALAASRGTLRALEQSEAMRSAEALAAKLRHVEDLEEHARQDRAGLERAERSAESRRREHEVADREVRQTERAREERLERARSAAAEARLEAACAAAAESLDADPEAAAATARTAAGRRREAIAELSGLVAEREAAREHWRRAEERRQDAEARLEAAAERARRAEREAAREGERLAEALAAWAAGATELAPDDAALGRLLEAAGTAGAEAVEPAREPGPESGEAAAGAAGEGAGGLAAAVARLAVSVRDERVRELADLDAERREAAAERAERAAERDRIAAGGALAPEPPPTRDADRTGRSGAPFYLLVDFRDDLAAGDRAGLEAALQASGLLDAWVSPGGRLLDPGTLDTVLAPAPRQRAGTLAEALAPAPGHGVSEEVIDALLRSVDWAGAPGGAGPAAGTETGAHRVGSDGSWRLGPLRGAWSKGEPEHVGDAAREAARARRLAELDELLAGLDRRLAELEAGRRRLAERLERLAAEVAAAPSEEALLQARLRAAATGEEEGRRRRELAAEEETTARARHEQEAAGRRLERRARELDPGREWTGRLEELDELARRLRDFEAAFERLVDAVGSHGAARERFAAAAALLADAVAERDALAARSAETGRRAATARAEHQALEATMGREAREVVARHGLEKERLDALEAAERALGEEREALIDRRAGARTRLDLHREELVARDADRGRAVAGLERLAALGFVQLALEPAPAGAAGEVAEGPPPEAPPPESLTAALQLAREIERAAGDVDLSDDAANRRANRLYERYQQLLADLGPDFQPSLRQEDELAVVRVVHNGAEREVPALSALLRENAETRRALLADHERELLRHFLLGEVGDHLRARLRRARELVGGMNELLEACPTASGMVLRLAWRPAGDAGPEVREAVELLQREPALLADAERRRLERFFLGRIEEARRRLEAVPWREHLMAALDYRRWHRFHVLRKTPPDDTWHELTRHGHAAASGGEKAVALHLPLFAAAAAHYRSARPEAPRLVMLDEAFAGIDQGMRGRCMKLLVDFDLDFLMTSHDEWGCYEELPGLAIYQLYRDPAFEGVGAVRFVWSGGRLAEERD